ncbi:hypothetical protein OAO87_03210 [bacterium]|nr:hypothetical protein [bacterium]
MAAHEPAAMQGVLGLRLPRLHRAALWSPCGGCALCGGERFRPGGGGDDGGGGACSTPLSTCDARTAHRTVLSLSVVC